MVKKILTALIFTLSLLSVSSQVFGAAGDNPFGTIINPLPNGGAGSGLVVLLNNTLRLVWVIAGIFAFLRIIGAGLSFINAGGDAKKIESAWNSIWQSIMGVAIIIASLAIAALMGLLLFGNVGAILNPQVYGPTTTP